MLIQNDAPAAEAVRRLARIALHDKNETLPDGQPITTINGRDMLTMADARAVLAWARESGEPVESKPVVDILDSAQKCDAESALFDPISRIIVISGPSGSGKNRLAQHLLRVAERAGPIAARFATRDEAASFMRDTRVDGPISGQFCWGPLDKPARVVLVKNFDLLSRWGGVANALQAVAAHRLGKVIVTTALSVGAAMNLLCGHAASIVAIDTHPDRREAA